MRANESLYESGNFVWTMNKFHRKNKCPKMQMQWIGPLVVLKSLNNVTYQEKMNKKEMKIIHYDLLKPCEAQGVL